MTGHDIARNPSNETAPAPYGPAFRGDPEYADRIAAIFAREQIAALSVRASQDLQRPMQPGEQMIFVPGEGENFIGVPASLLPEGYRHSQVVTVPPPLQPAPLINIDPLAQRALALGLGSGAAAAGIGYGLHQALLGIAALAGGSGLMTIAAVFLLSKILGGPSTVIYHTESHETTVNNTNRMLGWSKININN